MFMLIFHMNVLLINDHIMMILTQPLLFLNLFLIMITQNYIKSHNYKYLLMMKNRNYINFYLYSYFYKIN